MRLTIEYTMNPDEDLKETLGKLADVIMELRENRSEFYTHGEIGDVILKRQPYTAISFCQSNITDSMSRRNVYRTSINTINRGSDKEETR